MGQKKNQIADGRDAPLRYFIKEVGTTILFS